MGPNGKTSINSGKRSNVENWTYNAYAPTPAQGQIMIYYVKYTVSLVAKKMRPWMRHTYVLLHGRICHVGGTVGERRTDDAQTIIMGI